MISLSIVLHLFIVLLVDYYILFARVFSAIGHIVANCDVVASYPFSDISHYFFIHIDVRKNFIDFAFCCCAI